MLSYYSILSSIFTLTLFDSVFDQSSAIVDVAAVAAIFGSFMAYNRIKTALAASEAAGKAWHEERDAEYARAERGWAEAKRTEQTRLELVARVTALEARPDLGRIESLVRQGADDLHMHQESDAKWMRQHERNAEERTKRLVAAIQDLVGAKT